VRVCVHEGTYVWNEKRSRVEMRKSRDVYKYTAILNPIDEYAIFFGTPERSFSVLLNTLACVSISLINDEETET